MCFVLISLFTLGKNSVHAYCACVTSIYNTHRSFLNAIYRNYLRLIHCRIFKFSSKGYNQKIAKIYANSLIEANSQYTIGKNKHKKALTASINVCPSTHIYKIYSNAQDREKKSKI